MSLWLLLAGYRDYEERQVSDGDPRGQNQIDFILQEESSCLMTVLAHDCHHVLLGRLQKKLIVSWLQTYDFVTK